MERAFARGDRDAAIDAIGALQEAAPDSVETRLELAGLMVQAGSGPEAAWLLEDAVHRHPDRVDLKLALARVSLILADPARALELVEAVPPEAPEHVEALVLRARAELSRGDLDAALSVLSAGIEQYPDRPEMRWFQIVTLASERRYDEARRAIEAARDALPEDESRLDVDLALAQILAQQGETDAAIRTVEHILEDDPQQEPAWQVLVALLLADGRVSEALERVEAAVDAAQVLPGLRLLAAELHAALGNEDSAEDWLQRYRDEGSSPAAYLPLVRFLSNRGRRDEAISTLQDATARFPEDASLRFYQSEMLLDAGRIDEARAEIRRFGGATVAGDPRQEYLEARLELARGDTDAAAHHLLGLAPRLDQASTQFWLGRALELSGDLEGAQRRYGLARNRAPQWAAPSAALLRLAAQRSNWPIAAEHARDLTQRAPYRLDGWVALVGALEKMGDARSAEAVASAALERFPELPEPYVLRARSLRIQGRTDEALAALTVAEQKGGDPASLTAERVLALGIGGRVPEAIGEAREGARRHPDSAELQAALASVLFAAGEEAAGARAVDRALALDPEEPQPLRVRCQFRAATHRWSGARDDCVRYLDLRPEDAGAHFLLAVALEGLGEADAALEAYRRAADLDASDPDSRNNLAELLAAMGEVDEALAAAQEAYQLDPSNPYVLDTLGRLYHRKGLVERAVSVLEDAHAAAPGLPVPAFHLALAYRDLGRDEDARRLLGQLRRSDVSAELARDVEEAFHSLP